MKLDEIINFCYENRNKNIIGRIIKDGTLEEFPLIYYFDTNHCVELLTYNLSKNKDIDSNFFIELNERLFFPEKWYCIFRNPYGYIYDIHFMESDENTIYLISDKR